DGISTKLLFVGYSLKPKKGIEVIIAELKAIFFVKSLEGRGVFPPHEVLWNEENQSSARKIRVTFFDGETMVGTTFGLNRSREGFFVVPLEKDSNNLRIYVVFNAIKKIEILK
ncbi:MAG: DUF6982 domain-containing protein, partial [Thermodesulfobacteriota bacterium]